MVTRPNCTVHTEPDPGCEGCEDQFCGRCSLTNRNSRARHGHLRRLRRGSASESRTAGLAVDVNAARAGMTQRVRYDGCGYAVAGRNRQCSPRDSLGDLR